MTKDEIYWKPIAHVLRSLLDDIDTYSDMTKGDYEAFYKWTMKTVQSANEYLTSYDGMTWETPREEDG